MGAAGAGKRLQHTRMLAFARIAPLHLPCIESINPNEQASGIRAAIP